MAWNRWRRCRDHRADPIRASPVLALGGRGLGFASAAELWRSAVRRERGRVSTFVALLSVVDRAGGRLPESSACCSAWRAICEASAVVRRIPWCRPERRDTALALGIITCWDGGILIYPPLMAR